MDEKDARHTVPFRMSTYTSAKAPREIKTRTIGGHQSLWNLIAIANTV